MPSTPRHEADIERDTYLACFHAIRHPTALPTFFRELGTNTRAYYAGQDVVDLDKEEIIELLSWTRKMAIKSAGYGLIAGLSIGFAISRALS